MAKVNNAILAIKYNSDEMITLGTCLTDFTQNVIVCNQITSPMMYNFLLSVKSLKCIYRYPQELQDKDFTELDEATSFSGFVCTKTIEPPYIQRLLQYLIGSSARNIFSTIAVDGDASIVAMLSQLSMPTIAAAFALGYARGVRNNEHAVEEMSRYALGKIFQRLSNSQSSVLRELIGKPFVIEIPVILKELKKIDGFKMAKVENMTDYDLGELLNAYPWIITEEVTNRLGLDSEVIKGMVFYTSINIDTNMNYPGKKENPVVGSEAIISLFMDDTIDHIQARTGAVVLRKWPSP